MESLVVKVDADLEDLIPGFLENRVKDVIFLKEAIDRKDFEAIRILGHSMKGFGSGYGFDRISEIGLELELASKNEDEEIIHENIHILELYIQNVEIIIE